MSSRLDAEPIREHVWKLRKTMGVKEIAAASGVSVTTIMALTTGHPKSHLKKPTTPNRLLTVTPRTAHRLLSVGSEITTPPAAQKISQEMLQRVYKQGIKAEQDRILKLIEGRQTFINRDQLREAIKTVQK